MIDATHGDVVEVQDADSIAGIRYSATQPEIRRCARDLPINGDPFADESSRGSIVVENRRHGSKSDVVVVIKKDVMLRQGFVHVDRRRMVMAWASDPEHLR